MWRSGGSTRGPHCGQHVSTLCRALPASIRGRCARRVVCAHVCFLKGVVVCSVVVFTGKARGVACVNTLCLPQQVCLLMEGAQELCVHTVVCLQRGSVGHRVAVLTGKARDVQRMYMHQSDIACACVNIVHNNCCLLMKGACGDIENACLFVRLCLCARVWPCGGVV